MSANGNGSQKVIFDGVSKTFSKKRGEDLVVLEDVDLSVADGELVCLLGPSGCGKSTLLNIVGLLDNPTDGDYFFFDENVAGYSEAQRSAIRKKNIGFIFQSFNLIDELTVAENVELALLYHDMPSSERKQRVADALEKVGMAHRTKHFPSQLSGGQQQRVAVARAVVGEPSILLADEPTGNLDHDTGQEVLNLLDRLVRRAGRTMIMVTHSREVIGLADRLLTIRDCRLEESDC